MCTGRRPGAEPPAQRAYIKLSRLQLLTVELDECGTALPLAEHSQVTERSWASGHLKRRM